MGLNMELVRRRKAKIDKDEEDFKKGKNFDKLKEGKNKRRILPPWVQNGDWHKIAGHHYNILEQGGVLCPKITWDKPCPLCDLNKELFQSDSKEDKEYAKKIRAKERFYANVLNLDLNDSKVYVLEFGTKMEKEIIKIMIGDEGEDAEDAQEFAGVGDITDPKSGYNLQIKKTVPEDKMQTSYEVFVGKTATPVANWDEVSKNLVNLDEYVKKDEYSFDDLTAMANGTYKGNSSSGASTQESNAPKAEETDEFGDAKTEAKNESASSVTDEFDTPNEAVQPTPEKPAGQTGEAKSALERLKKMKEGKTK